MLFEGAVRRRVVEAGGVQQVHLYLFWQVDNVTLDDGVPFRAYRVYRALLERRGVEGSDELEEEGKVAHLF